MSSRSYETETYGRAKHGRNSRRRKKKKRFPVLILVLIILVALIGVATEVINHFTPTKEKADLQALYGAPDGYASILANHQWLESEALWENEHAYLDYNVVRGELNGRFFYDPTEHLLLYTMPEETLTVGVEDTYDGAPVFLERDGLTYISLSYVQQYTNIEAANYSDPARLVLQTEFGEEQQATLKKASAVRVKGGIKSPVITELGSGATVVVLEEFDNWMRVQTPDGWIGFLEKDVLDEVQTVQTQGPDREPEYSNIQVDHEVCYVWQQSLNSSCIKQLETLLASEAMNSVNTVGPTWFSISSFEGECSDRSSSEYVDLAHANGLDVWPVLDNVNDTTVDMVALLKSTTNRTRLVQSVISAVEASGADGLNVDLENIPQEAADGYIQLIREFSVECRKRSLVLSVDNMVPSAWSEYYNRKEQGIVADYVIIMGYDEHYSGSEIGSTASLPYVEEAIVGTIADVPAEKVINGVPFYSRLWKESATSVDSEAIGMDGMQEFIAKYNATPQWDSECAQNVVRVEEGEMIYQLWLEDTESMEARLQMMQNYSLGGVACWKQGMESQDVWSIFSKYYPK